MDEFGAKIVLKWNPVDVNKTLVELQQYLDTKSLKVKIEIDDKRFKELSNNLQSLNANLNKSLNIKPDISGLNVFEQKIDNINKKSKSTTIEFFDANKALTGRKEIEELSNSLGKLQKITTNFSAGNETSSSIENTTNYEKQRVAVDKLNVSKLKLLATVEKYNGISGYENVVGSINGLNADSTKTDVQNIKANIESLKQQQQIQSSLSQTELNRIKNAEKLAAEENKIFNKEQLQQYESNLKLQKKNELIRESIRLYQQELNAKIKNNQTTYGKHLSSTGIEGIINQASLLDIDNFESKKKQIDADFKDITANARALRRESTLAMKEADSFVTTLLKDFGKMIAWGLVATAIYSPIRALQAGLDILRELDSLMVDIAKVTNISADAMESLKSKSFEAANAFGRTAQDYLKGIAEFSRAGYEGQSAEDLSKISLLAQNVGELTTEQANQFLLATDAAYKYKGSQEKLMAVLDGANTIDNKFATSIAKVSEGITVAGSIASNASVGIDELASAVGTMTAITQRSGNEAGRAFRSILMNIRQIKGETEDGEIIDDASLSKSAKALDGVGIKVHEMRNGIEELRNPMAILEELSNKWKSLSTMQTSPIIEALGGKYRGNEQMLTASCVQKCA